MNNIFLRVLTILMLLAGIPGRAQSLLDTRVSIASGRRPVKEVFEAIEKKCHCSFSYNSELVHTDSLVNIKPAERTARQLLEAIFADRFQYKELDGHIIIVPAEREKWFTVSGHVYDAFTGLPVADVSVFERQQLAAVLTAGDGSFRLHMKDKSRYPLAEITVSKGGFYMDTSFSLQPGYDRDVSVQLTPADHTLPDIQVTPYSGTERSWFGRHFFSSGLRKQSANLGKFFTDKPVQASFVPGIGSHGKLSGQVTNSFSLNVLGGYTAGVNGFELGGLFNIDKKDVRYAQVGGIFNIVSGSVAGVQVGGIANQVGGSVSGVQVSGITSLVSKDINGVLVAGICSRAGGTMKGLQISGISNILDNKAASAKQSADTAFTMEGMQLAGIANVVNRSARGFQLAGIANLCWGNMQGLQMSGIVNIAGRLEGSQVGLINIADTVTGYSIGLINIVRKGYHTLCLSTNEFTTMNAAYKTGTKHLYSILTAGVNNAPGAKVFVYGLGIGSERRISDKTGFSTELCVMNVYERNIDKNALFLRAEPAFNWNIRRWFSLYTGPSLCFVPYQFSNAAGFAYPVPSAALYDFKTGYNTATWIGWQVGLHIF